MLKKKKKRIYKLMQTCCFGSLLLPKEKKTKQCPFACLHVSTYEMEPALIDSFSVVRVPVTSEGRGVNL